jgi:hypothetical protein
MSFGAVTTVTDPYPAGLDPAHILAICTHATGGRPGLAVGTRDGMCVCLPSQRLARSARAALGRVGYHVTDDFGPRGRDLVVTGWNPAGLESRLTAMRVVLHQLAENPSPTARAVIERFRSLPSAAQSSCSGLGILDEARSALRSWVSARSGIHAPRPPAVLPPDVGVALQLGTARVLERAIDDLIERHLRVAGHALALFCSLREQMDIGRAQDVAIRWAGITFHLGGTSAQDSTPLLQSALRFPDDDAASGRQPGSRPHSGPVSREGVGFPRMDTRVTTGSQALTTAPPARPGGGHLRADRPGLRP